MCYFITATVPSGIDSADVAAAFARHGRVFTPIANRHVAAQLGPGVTHGVTRPGRCDCGTALGSLSRPGSEGTSASESQLERLRRQRWSEAGIQRWLEQKGKPRDSFPPPEHGVDAVRWMDLLVDVLTSGNSPQIGLLLHSYSASVQTEKVAITDHKAVEVSQLNTDMLLRMPEDVLYTFAR